MANFFDDSSDDMQQQKKFVNLKDFMDNEDGMDIDDEIEDILNEPDLMDLSLVAISKELEIRNFFTLMQMKYGPQIHVKNLTRDEEELYNKIYNAIIYNSSFDINDDEEDQ